MPPTIHLKNARSILWLTPERLGDAVMGTPALEVLKKARPDLAVDLLAFSETSAAVYRHNPLIRTTYLNPSSRVRQQIEATCDLMVHTHPDVDHKQLATIDLPWIAPEQPQPEQHQARVQVEFIRRQLDLSESPIPDYTLLFTPADHDAVRQRLLRHNPDPQRDLLIGCSIGCNRIARRGLKFWKPLAHPKVWPMDHLHRLDHILSARMAYARLVLIGAGSERRLAEAFLRKSPRAIDMTGGLTIPQLAALVDSLDAVISADTGLLHVACARRKPLLALHGPTQPERTGPFPPAPFRRIVRAESMASITPDSVLAELGTILAGNPKFAGF